VLGKEEEGKVTGKRRRKNNWKRRRWKCYRERRWKGNIEKEDG
jgi:hypothetical protein